MLKKLYLLHVISIVFFTACIQSCTGDKNDSTIDHLRVNTLISPLGIDTDKPDFSWQMQSQRIGIKQSAYQIVVAKDQRFTEMVWDSGMITSNQSVGIVYGGSSLAPETDYYWKVNITDSYGKTHTASSFFSTGLMNPTINAWDNAQWIGSNELSLDATSAQLFHISTKYKIISGNKLSLIFGANDFRFNNNFQNVERMEGENYYRFELDLSGVGTPNGAAINIYRVGYLKTDSPEYPFITISKATIPTCNINELITTANAYQENTLDIHVSASAMTVEINGKALQLNNNPTPRMGGGGIILSPYGKNGGDYNTYPNLNSIGFYTATGEKVEFTDYALKNVGQGREADLFNQSIGATYSIFNHITGLTVSDNKISVDEGTFGYADPSHYASLSMLRNEFETESEKKIQKADMYITAMGSYEMYVNGKRMGNDWFNPGVSQYRETLNYHTYNVTDLLKNGKNVLGAILGPGFYTGYMTFTPNNYNFFGDTEALLAKLVITYTDGNQRIITTNPKEWKLYKKGPVEYASMFHGQRYNANKESAIAGWTTVGYQENGWVRPEIIKKRDWINFDIIARRDNPVREIERLQATRVLTTHSDDKKTYTYDMGVDMVGVPSITIPAGSLKEGDTVILRYGEEIYPGNEDSPNKVMPDGTTYESLYGANGIFRPNVAGRILHETYRAALVTDFYTASKEDESRNVLIEPHFTYRGYRYIQITTPNRTSPLPIQNVEGIVLSSENVTASYKGSTSDNTGELINQLFRNIQRSQLGNFFSIPTDCPQRNERMGWTGDAQAYARTATYNGDVQSFFRQWMVTLRNDQGIGGANGEPAGGVGTTIPTYSRARSRNFAASSTWAAAVCMVPWQLYTQYGDIEVVKENFDAMKAWLDGMNHFTVPGYPGLSSRTGGLADHLSFDARTSSDLCNNAIYLYMMEVTAIMSEAIGKTAYANELRNRYMIAKESFNRAYIDPDIGMTRSISITDGSTGRLIDTQTSYATPLNFNCFSDTMRITSGEYNGMTYEAFAAKRLAELSAKPSRSGNEGNVLIVHGGRDMPLGATAGVAMNPTKESLDYTITTGFSGTPNMLPALTRFGQSETAYKLFSSTDFASWLYSVKLGATSVWERWNSYELAFEMNAASGMNSFNHFALGSVGSWIHEFHLGITTDNGGYQDFVLQPLPGGTYTNASGTFISNYGTIKSCWNADKGKLLSYDFTIPPNTSATVYLPLEESVMQGFSSIAGIQYLGMDTRNGVKTAKFKAEAGSYQMKLSNGKWHASIVQGYITE
ncbi:family 78 glycoside hydrolase catalytic domain [Parabacteroides sp. PF5-9]|uniref:family 78 glycoside hydrolase catalytic domain n=1 Tax=Parabacteroides sp. PF5-9 TaxID=1742404 RepID=UPI00247645B2|nr:family 78 glycoside hydrolase catalytic domain [Parabacteroides sp. PF5-9]MDH6359084.1 alpha-L-rhamnosidase [Parabacteroides sp. PF5-9]